MAADVVVIFALDREAGPFRRLATRDRLPVRVVVAGMGVDAAKRAAEGVSDARLVVSAGFCGALDPALKVGDVVVCETAPFSRDPEARRRGARNLPPSATASPIAAVRAPLRRASASRLNGVLISVPHIVATPHDKRELREQTAADIVDMEAAAVAAVCAARGLPFLAVKAVSDTADTALSPRLARLLSGGAVSPWKAAAALLVQPSLLFAFARLARDTRVAADRLAAGLRDCLSR